MDCWLCMLPILIVVLFLASSYAVARSQVGHRAAVKRLPILFACVAAALGTAAVFRRLPIGWRDYAWPAFLMLFCVWLWIHLAVCLKRVAAAGEVLLEIGRPPSGLYMVIVGGGGVLVACIVLLSEAIAVWRGTATTRVTRDIPFFFFVLSMSACVVLLGACKRSIRERGIIISGQLLRWEKIQGFEWDRENPCMLVLDVKRRFPWWRSIHVPVPADKRDAVNELLQRKLSASSQSGGAG